MFYATEYKILVYNFFISLTFYYFTIVVCQLKIKSTSYVLCVHKINTEIGINYYLLVLNRCRVLFKHLLNVLLQKNKFSKRKLFFYPKAET